MSTDSAMGPCNRMRNSLAPPAAPGRTMPPVTPDLTRFDDWLAFLRKQGAADPDIRVIWVGGSAATGGWDEWSDLDVEVLCTPGETTPVYDRLLGEARGHFAIDHVWELPLAA